MSQVNMRSLDGGTMTVSVNVTRELRWRIAVGLFFIKLGVRITGMGVIVEKSYPDPRKQ